MPGFNINGDGKGPSSLVEVVRTHRWRLEFLQIQGLRDIQQYALSCQRPSMEIDTIVMHNGQTRINLPGKYKWNPINVKFYEVLTSGGTTALKIFEYWSESARAVVNFNTNTINPEFRSSNTNISLEDGAGNWQHLYVLQNAWPSKVAPADLTYSSSDIATIQVTLTYDSALEHSQAVGIL
jgi:phage tail-like protein